MNKKEMESKRSVNWECGTNEGLLAYDNEEKSGTGQTEVEKSRGITVSLFYSLRRQIHIKLPTMPSSQSSPVCVINVIFEQCYVSVTHCFGAVEQVGRSMGGLHKEKKLD